MNHEDWGRIRLCRKELPESHGMTRYRLYRLTGIKYDTTNQYYKGVGMERVDVCLLGKMGAALGCGAGGLFK